MGSSEAGSPFAVSATSAGHRNVGRHDSNRPVRNGGSVPWMAMSCGVVTTGPPRLPGNIMPSTRISSDSVGDVVPSPREGAVSNNAKLLCADCSHWETEHVGGVAFCFPQVCKQAACQQYRPHSGSRQIESIRCAQRRRFRHRVPTSRLRNAGRRWQVPKAFSRLLDAQRVLSGGHKDHPRSKRI